MKTKENKGQIRAKQIIIDKDEEKCVELAPADIPYDKYMEVVKDNEELKEIIVNLVKKLNRRGF